MRYLLVAGIAASLGLVAATVAAAQPLPEATALMGQPSGGGAPALPLSLPDARRGESLDGRWRIIIDPLSMGDRSPITSTGEGSAFYLDKTPRNGMELQEYAFVDSVAFNVPGQWNDQDPRLFFYEGPVWYRRNFEDDGGSGRRILHFEAANYRADIYVNGKLAGRHEGGFTPFSFDVTSLARKGANSLVVKVDNRLDASTVPTRNSDWLNRGGLTRSVRLVREADAFVRTYGVRMVDGAAGRIRAEVQVDGGHAGERVTVAVPELRRSAQIAIDAEGKGAAEFTAPVALWSPKSPRLYDVTVSYRGATMADRVGFRTIERRGADILLNGRPIFLKGIAYEEPTGLVHGRKDAEALVAEAKALGCNYLRLGQYPNDSWVARVADEQGLLLWEEVPVYWTMDWTNPKTLAVAQSQIRELIARDRNRASVILWSIGNETPMGPQRLAFLTELAKTVRAEDPSRLLTSALLGDPLKEIGRVLRVELARLRLDASTPADKREAIAAWFVKTGQPASPEAMGRIAKETQVVIDDPLGELVDVVSLNEYFGWYYSAPLSKISPVDEATLREAELQLMPELSIRTRYDKPILLSEFGADAKGGVIGDERTVTTEAYQARLLRQQLKLVRNSPNLRGLSPWVLKDFQTPLRTHPIYEQYWNRKGLIADTGRHKLAYDVLRGFYTSIGDAPTLATAPSTP